ncbi:MAG: hypothetical protein AAB650_00070 [Patescibacteria group bacterium]
MIERLAAILHRLQARPAGERRILAMATYASAVAVVFIIWVSSFSSVLTIVPDDSYPGVFPRATPKSESRSSLAELLTPFQALYQSALTTFAKLEELRRQFDRRSTEVRNAAGGVAGARPPVEKPALPSLASPPDNQVKPSSVLSLSPLGVGATPRGIAITLNVQLANLSYNRSLVAKLVAPPPASPEQKSSLRQIFEPLFGL